MAQDPSTADAFALSPLSARASQPSEADYDAIRDAFMETARGRWFLSEYAKRNRNADTGMVLDAVARIEASVAGRGAGAPSSAALIAAIRPLIAEARAAADAATTAAEIDSATALARRGTRIIREISWSLRETGTDPRICNILDAQLLVLETLHDQVANDVRNELVGEVFDDLIMGVEEIGSGVRMAERESAVQTPEPVERVGANADLAAAMASPAPPQHEAPHVEAVPAAFAADEIAVFSPTDDEIAADDAMLDLIALEMTAPEIDDADDFGAYDAIADLNDLAAATALPPPAAMALPVPELPPSLGATLIANGIVRARAAGDALAPFRRMSQTEKIAFFS